MRHAPGWIITQLVAMGAIVAAGSWLIRVGTVRGTPGADQLLGTPGSDTILGFQGDDRAEGGEGADHLNGGQGSDAQDGGDGDDVILGGDGNDVVGLLPHTGPDRIRCGDGWDRVYLQEPTTAAQIAPDCEIIITPQVH
jgi:Ca2+-binding RTX toxin-like protein